MKFSTLSLSAIGLHGATAATLRGDSKRELAVLYYPRYTGDYNTGWCTSNNNFAQGSPGYATELACCNAAFNQQTTGACYAKLPSPPTASPTGADGPDAYYPNWNLDFNDGICINKSPPPNGIKVYDTELDCCKGEYATQTSGKCLAALPNPPTVSPTADGGPDAYYADITKDWKDGVCINKMPAPLGAKIYDTELECCKGQYGSQTSGACLAALPNPPTVSPTADGGPDAYYADFTKDWKDGVCINKMPAPLGAKIYDTELECCKGQYASQTSGACLAALPNPPTVSPTADGGPDAYYADLTKDWKDGVCINKMPAPIGAKIYDTELECCKGQYASQSSGACLAALPNPPTVSPTADGGPDAYYKAPNMDWSKGYCINTMPAPSGAVIYDTELECCKAAFAGQTSGACLAALPSPPTVSPTGENGPDAWYKKPDIDWDDGYCTNTLPAPVGATIYDTELECCKGQYLTQNSGACLAALPSPPTASPIGASTAKFFPIFDTWETGHCDNDPTSATASTSSYRYDTQEECCDAWFKSQSTGYCMKFDPTYGSRSPTQAPIQ
jgi:hypothetical protein